ncbi:MAG: hypothetical protein H6672_19460 [Anaerolineaceae bacterium]|nr:hypothetical protein [Anaerolineaceae bacterium]
MPETVQDTLQAALDDNKGRFIALTLAEIPSGKTLFLHADPDLPDDFADALDKLAKRAATFTENHDQFDKVDEVLFYDIEGRQIVLYLIKRQPFNQILVIVAAPKKAYKQAGKRLAKTLHTL